MREKQVATLVSVIYFVYFIPIRIAQGSGDQLGITTVITRNEIEEGERRDNSYTIITRKSYYYKEETVTR